MCVHEIGEDKEWLEKVLGKILYRNKMQCTDYFATMY